MLFVIYLWLLTRSALFFRYTSLHRFLLVIF